MVRKGDCGQRTKELIARYYLTLMGEFREDSGKLYLSMDRCDMFHSAITLILQDNRFQHLETDEAIMQNIRRRIRNVIKEIVQDARILNKRKEDKDADHLQTEEV